ncbi:hypothetical protein PAPHI01_2487 [Pancytospora philotis]|nr:hypothetical protein PAPHI01_2487 [Pancytospora philotis]
MQDNGTSINKHVFDMATNNKSWGEFAGKQGECIEQWVERIKMIRHCSRLDDRTIAGMTLMSLRGEAEAWASEHWTRLVELPVEALMAELIQRFTNSKETAEVVSRFFTAGQSKTYVAYMKLLADATTCYRRGCVNSESLIKQVIVRSPGDIKSMLLQAANESADWTTFVTKAEGAAWIAFPERVVNEVMVQDTEQALVEAVGNSGLTKYCRLHGNGSHYTSDCEVVRLVESKGWRRGKPNQKKQQSMNKIQDNYMVYSMRRGDKVAMVSSFKKVLELGTTKCMALLDTGADVSLMRRDCVPRGLALAPVQMLLRSVTGAPIKVLGRASIKFKIQGIPSMAEFIVTEDTPQDHVLLGSDWICENAELFVKLVMPSVASIDGTVTTGPEIENVSEKRYLEKYKYLMSNELPRDKACNVLEHRIETGNTAPISAKGYPIPYQWEEVIGTQVQDMLRTGIIRNSKSEWSSNIVPVKKKDGSLRLCVDYRPLNGATSKDEYPLPRIDWILDKLGKARFFSSLDATSGYHQIRVAEQDKKKTAFRFKGGFYEYNRMPFGLCNAPPTFQRIMDTIFQREYGLFVIPYLDDIIVFSETKRDHEQHLDCVMKRISDYNLILNPKKCKLFKQEIEILGRVVAEGIVKPSPDKIRAIREFKRPRTIRELRSFIGLVNFCREFITELSRKAAPLFKLLEGETKRSIKSIVFSEKEEQCFQELKKEITEHTLRYQPDMEKTFFVTTDASDYAISGILSQKDDAGREHIVHSYSKSMEKAQRNYSVTDKELLAVVKTLEHFRKYLVGKPFILKTDHQALTSLHKSQNLNARLARWAMKLHDYQFDVVYIKGENNAADGLSRYTQEATKGLKKEMHIAEVREDRQRTILQEYHCLSGHGSAATMKFLLCGRYSWATMHKDIDDWVNQCGTCQQAGHTRVNSKNRALETKHPNELWEMDLIGRIDTEKKKGQFVLVCVDHFTKWVEARTLNEKSAIEVKKAIESIVQAIGAFPKRVLTDNGTEFRNAEVKEWAKRAGVHWEYSSPYHHETVGLVERTNQTLWNKVKLLSRFGQLSLKNAVKKAAFGTNISYNRAIDTSPYIARFGHKPKLPVDTEMDALCLPDAPINHEELLKKICEHRERYKPGIIKGTITIKRDIEIGAQVLVFNHVKKGKLDRNWIPGFYVMQHIGEDAYEVSDGIKNMRLNKVHVKRA